jgi:hypothetical protein
VEGFRMREEIARNMKSKIMISEEEKGKLIKAR